MVLSNERLLYKGPKGVCQDEMPALEFFEIQE
jgi:hypothetical protein